MRSMSQAVARTKVCPFIKPNNSVEQVSTCYVSDCMAWRWEHEATVPCVDCGGNRVVFRREEYKPCPTCNGMGEVRVSEYGYCGAAHG